MSGPQGRAHCSRAMGWQQQRVGGGQLGCFQQENAQRTRGTRASSANNNTAQRGSRV